VVKEKKKENKRRALFDKPIFTNGWYDDDLPTLTEDVYTFT
jgi:hypothetical protein